MRLSPQPWLWKHADGHGTAKQELKKWEFKDLLSSDYCKMHLSVKCLLYSLAKLSPSFLPALSRLREINQFLQALFFWKATSIRDRKEGGNYGVTPEDYFHFLYKKFVLSSDIKWPHLSFKLNLKLQNLNSVS